MSQASTTGQLPSEIEFDAVEKIFSNNKNQSVLYHINLGNQIDESNDTKKSRRSLVSIGRNTKVLPFPNDLPHDLIEIFTKMENDSTKHFKKKITDWGTFKSANPQVACSGCGSKSYYYCNCCTRNRSTVFCLYGPCHAQHVARACVDAGIDLYYEKKSKEKSEHNDDYKKIVL